MTQPKALQLAESTHLGYRVSWQKETAAELRRLHEVNQMLVDAAEMALKFCEDIGDLGGPYPYVDQTSIVGDSRKVLQALRQALAQHVDAVNISQECVDETAKGEHEPEWIEDGFGTMWQKCGKKDCGKFVVKIGKVDCWNGDCPEAKEQA